MNVFVKRTKGFKKLKKKTNGSKKKSKTLDDLRKNNNEEWSKKHVIKHSGKPKKLKE